jgi:hypothetical protein
MANFPYGQQVRFSATFTDLVTGQLADPSTVTAKIRPQNGATEVFIFGQTADIVQESTGVYHLDFKPNVAGTKWYCRWEGAGAIVTANEMEIQVNQTNF